MGQVENCSVCGKPFKTCKHYVREHIPVVGTDGAALCGRPNMVLLPKDWENNDCVVADICRVCLKVYNKQILGD